MALSANSGSERARQLITLTQRLGERLVQETISLEAHRPQDIYTGIEETRQLSNMYRHESLRIKMDKSLLEGITPAEKRELREATELFQARLHRYELAVNAARLVTEGIIEAVAKDLNAIRSRGMTYGARGRTIEAPTQSLNYGKSA